MLINEIFTSIDGEVNKWGQGIITTFIRTQGCNLRCSYCDTLKSQGQDEDTSYSIMYVDDIVDAVLFHGTNKVTITGGEPLEQETILDLIDALLLCEIRKISVETNGTHIIPFNYIGGDINWIVDYKWEYKDKMKVNWENLHKLDWIKFVVSPINIEEIFEEIKAMRREGVVARIAVSALGMEHKDLMNQLIKEKLFDVSLNVQLHKLINVS